MHSVVVVVVVNLCLRLSLYGHEESSIIIIIHSHFDHAFECKARMQRAVAACGNDTTTNNNNIYSKAGDLTRYHKVYVIFVRVNSNRVFVS